MNPSKKQSVIGVVFNHDRNRVLLIKRRDIPIWVLPGGGVDDNEHPDQAVVRELNEETGYIVKIKQKIGEYSPIHWLTTETHLYECVPIDGLPSIGDETTEIRFFPLDQLPKKMPQPFPSWINDAANFRSLIQRPITELNNRVVLHFFLKNPLLISKFIFTRVGFIKQKIFIKRS